MGSILNKNMSNVDCHELKLQIGEDEENTETIQYSPNPQHRDNNPNKSQWIITEDEEMNCFKTAYSKGWVIGNNAWSLHYIQNELTYLGIGVDRSTNLFIAKFKNDISHSTWHGYPADYQQNAQDVPGTDILRDWIKCNVLPKAKISKIMKGQPCKL